MARRCRCLIFAWQTYNSPSFSTVGSAERADGVAGCRLGARDSDGDGGEIR
jgi:hypothetical protein